MKRPPASSLNNDISTDRILRVEFKGNLQRVRKVVSRSNARATGKWPSWKLGRMAYYDSLNECNAFKLLDAWPAVKYYAEQPCRIHYVMTGETRLHIPDILVHLGHSDELWEVKTEQDAHDPEIQRRTALMTRCMPSFGYNYRMVIGEDLARQPRLGNIESLLRLGREPVPMVERERLRRMFGVTKELPWTHFQPGATGDSLRRRLCRLLLEGELSIDIEEVWGDSTMVRWIH